MFAVLVKYMSIVNFWDNIIDSEQIRSYYKKDFQKRFSLHLNADSHEIADTCVYMLVSIVIMVNLQLVF